MTEFRVDPRQTTAEERAEGVRQAQVLFKLNHTMPFTDERIFADTAQRRLFRPSENW